MVRPIVAATGAVAARMICGSGSREKPSSAAMSAWNLSVRDPLMFDQIQVIVSQRKGAVQYHVPIIHFPHFLRFLNNMGNPPALPG